MAGVDGVSGVGDLDEGITNEKSDGRISVRYHWILALQLTFILFCLPSSPKASADGGAPNLAYIAGTASGVSVIDVGQAKVTKTIAVAGDPHMILLSPDGQFLYATQASLGRVAVINAKTGQTVCAGHLQGHPTVLASLPDRNFVLGTNGGEDEHESRAMGLIVER